MPLVFLHDFLSRISLYVLRLAERIKKQSNIRGCGLTLSRGVPADLLCMIIGISLKFLLIPTSMIEDI